MTGEEIILITIGSFFCLGLIADAIARNTKIPRVTLLVSIGVLIGPQVFDVIPHVVEDQFDWLTSIALVMVGFLLGGKLTASTFSQLGTSLFSISLGESLCAALMVGVGMFVVGVPWQVALVLGCIAAATAAEIAFDAVVETKAQSPFSKILLGAVALDDVWSLLLFSAGLAVIAVGSDWESLGTITRELGGGILLGIVIGLPASAVTGRLKPGEPILLEALAVVFICGGLALWLEVSFLLAAITTGCVIANLARHHERPFTAIENIEWPFLLLFFILAGTLLEFDSLITLLVPTVMYVILRIVGKFLGGYAGASIAGNNKTTKRWIGLSLLPQAGAAIGMALVASHYLPQYQQLIIQIVIASSIVFELLGPVLTTIALKKNEA